MILMIHKYLVIPQMSMIPTRLIIHRRVKTQKKIGISSGTVLLVAGLYVFTSILPVMVIILRLIIIIPLLQAGIWNCMI